MRVIEPLPAPRSIRASFTYAYILLALTWGNLYSLVEIFAGGAFRMNEAHQLDLHLMAMDMVYYSFVTLTTTGYGDITPITAHAK